ncbi:MAG: 5-formyltetrahydrofolate cyclo-ligase [Muribaculaceae bacterium]
MDDKAQLRKQMRAIKALISPSQMSEQAQSVFSTIECLQAFKLAHNILLYCALPDELPTQSVLHRWSNLGKNIMLPRVDGNDINILQFDANHLMHGSFGIMEPSSECKSYNIHDVDLVIVPAMAYDAKGHRLGRGKGYYDRLLANARATKIGVGFNQQILALVPHHKHDVAMDIVVSASKIYFTHQ